MEFTPKKKQCLAKLVEELTNNDFIAFSVINLSDNLIATYRDISLDEAIETFENLSDKEIYHFTMLLLNNYDFNKDNKLTHPAEFALLKSQFEDAWISPVYDRMFSNLVLNSPNDQREADEVANQINTSLNSLIKTFSLNGNQKDSTANIHIMNLSQSISRFAEYANPLTFDEQGNPRHKYVYVVFWNNKPKDIFDICEYLNRYLTALNQTFGATINLINYTF